MVDGEILKQIISNAQKIADDCEYSAASNFALSRRWDRWNLFLGSSAAILSALAAISIDKIKPSWLYRRFSDYRYRSFLCCNFCFRSHISKALREGKHLS